MSNPKINSWLGIDKILDASRYARDHAEFGSSRGVGAGDNFAYGILGVGHDLAEELGNGSGINGTSYENRIMAVR